MEIDCVESILSASAFLNHAFGANTTNLYSNYEWPVDVLKLAGIQNFYVSPDNSKIKN